MATNTESVMMSATVTMMNPVSLIFLILNIPQLFPADNINDVKQGSYSIFNR